MTTRPWVVLVFATGCLEASSVPCGTQLCPLGTTCVMLEEQTPWCATKPELDACLPGATCSGACDNGVCLPIACGDGRMQGSEVCDDGNTISGDRCSGDCMSLETCGNHYLDAVRLDANRQPQPNEQCDDGNLVSGDGCSSTCRIETPAWRQIIAAGPGVLNGAAMAYDTDRRRAVMFGGFNASADATSGTFEYGTIGDDLGWLGVDAPNGPPSRGHAALAYDPQRHRTVLFGGEPIDNETPAFGDTWEWDGARWEEAATSGGPSARAHAAMVTDPSRKTIVLFGGTTRSLKKVPIVRDDVMWEWHDGAWHAVTTGTLPPPRWCHAMAYDAARDVLVLVGGIDAHGQILTDTWEYRPGTGAWTQATPTAPAPARACAALAFDGSGVVLAGGDTAVSPLSGDPSGETAEVWKYDGTTWARVVGKDLSAKRADFPMVSAGQGWPILYGGFTGLVPLGDTQFFQFGSWQTASSQPSAPSPRSLAQAAYDPLSHTGYLFGGSMGNSDDAQLWTLDAHGAWGRPIVLPGNSPSARHAGGLAYDTMRAELVLFGGQVVGEPAGNGETWTFAAEMWTQHTTGPQPPGRFAPVMVFDPVRGRTVMFGGATDANLIASLADTWEWDGVAWAPIATPISPPGRALAAASFDAITHHVIITGGLGDDALFLDDTWSYDGTTWTNLGPGPQPPRFGALMTYDGTRRRSVLFGGSSGGAFADTWEWDDAAHAWTKLLVSTAPPGRFGGVAMPSSAGAGAVVFGGLAGFDSGTLGDLWTLRSESTTAPELCELAVDADGDGAVGCDDPDCWMSCTPLCPPTSPASCAASAPHCGDGACGAFETCRGGCDACACDAECGDGYCDAGETAASCAADCP